MRRLVTGQLTSLLELSLSPLFSYSLILFLIVFLIDSLSLTISLVIFVSKNPFIGEGHTNRGETIAPCATDIPI